MKKSYFKEIVMLVCCSLIFASCSNFLKGNDLKDEVNSVIEYANSEYADITINAQASATEYISPSVGNYNSKYKKGDDVKLSFTPVSSFQFVQWKADPADSMDFGDPKLQALEAKILSSENPITIYPEVYRRPAVTFSPKNGSSVEKNTPVIITFSNPMEFTEDDLKEIRIGSGGLSYNGNFSDPVLSEDKTTVTFTAKEDSLITFDESTKDITVSVPVYYYNLNGVKIYMEKEVDYVYTVNNQTLTKLKLSVNNTNTAAGSTNLNGEYEYSIGHKQNILFNILQEYAFEKWIVKNAEGQELTDQTYSQFFEFEDVNSNSTNITVKKLGQGFVIEPVVIKRPQVVASTPVYDTVGANRASNVKFIFDQDMSESSIYWTEAELKLIKTELEQSGTCTVAYADYKADGKKDATGNQYYYAYTVTSGTVTNRYFKNIEIKKRESSESLLDGNYYGCPYFETSSILVIPTDKSGTSEPLPGRIDIEVVLKKAFVNTSGIELAKMYTACYRTDGRYDVTPPKVDYMYLDAGWGEQCYSGYTAEEKRWKIWDDVQYDLGRITYESNNEFWNEIIRVHNIMNTYIQNRITGVSQAQTVKELAENYGVKDTKTITFQNNFEVTDETGISDITITLIPVKNLVYPNQSEEIFTVYKQCDGEKKIVIQQNQKDTHWVFDFSSIETEGLYKVELGVTDVVGNTTKIPFIRNFVYTETVNGSDDQGIWPMEYNAYIILDNIFTGGYTRITDRIYYGANNQNVTTMDGYYNIYGYAGKYAGYSTTSPLTLTKTTVTALYNLSSTTKRVVTEDGGMTNASINIGTGRQFKYLFMEDTMGNLKGIPFPFDEVTHY